MKKHSFLLPLTLTFTFVVFCTQVQAQRVGLSANFSAFNIDQVSDNNTSINYAGSSSVGLNLRYFTDKKWAFRAGVGMDNLQYTVGDGLQTDYAGRRQDLKGVFGLEKHLMLGPIDIYPGVFVPIVVVGDDNILNDNYDNIQNGNMRAGLGVLLGANLRILRILRVGVEFDATYDNFRTGVWESVNQSSLVPFSGISRNVVFTVGVFL